MRLLPLLFVLACVRTPPDDDGPAQPEVPLDGWGEISGDCGLIRDALADPSPALFRSTLAVEDWAPELLSDGAQELLDTGNLGGSSLESEAVAFELLYRCEGAVLLATEAQIVYQDEGGTKTDLLVEIAGERLGTSVTRAFTYPPDSPFDPHDAAALAAGKLADVLASTDNVDPEGGWDRQILFVLAWDTQHADAFEAAWDELDGAIRADTLVVVTTTDGDDDGLYGDF